MKNLDNTLGQIKIDKDKDIHLHGANIYEGSGSYNRCAIVATNIAEASITIDKLKIVIDTGKQKVNKFDRKTRTETLGTEGITESSRLQRKGRVGRTNPGEIHYIYEQGTMKNNRIQLGMSIKDITFDILNLLQNTYNEQEFISVDVNVPETDLIYLFMLNHSFVLFLSTNLFLKICFCSVLKLFQYLGNLVNLSPYL